MADGETNEAGAVPAEDMLARAAAEGPLPGISNEPDEGDAQQAQERSVEEITWNVMREA